MGAENNYSGSIQKVKDDIGEIEAAMLRLDGVIANSATKLANASKKLSAATPKQMNSNIDKSIEGLKKYDAAIGKSQKLLETQVAKEIQVRESAANKKEALEQKTRQKEIAASQKAIAQKEKEFKQFEKEYNKYIQNLEKKAAAEQKAADKAKINANKQQLSDAKLYAAREKAFDNYEKSLQKQRLEEKKSELYQLQRNQKYLDNLEKEKRAREKQVNAVSAFNQRMAAQKDVQFNKEAQQVNQAASKDAKQIANQRALSAAADLEAKATSKLLGAYANLNAKRDQAKKRLQDLLSAEKQNVVQIRKAQKEYDRLSSKINKANAATNNFTKGGLGGAVRGLKNLAGAFGFVGGLYLFADMAKQGFELAKKLDSLNFAMKAIITDSQELARAQFFLSNISEKYGASIVPLTERFIKFSAAAKQSGLAVKETEQIFGSFTKVSGVLGLKSDELNGVFLALEQMLSKGKVTTEELRRQLGERLPGAFGIMAQTLQVLNPDMEITVQTLDDMLKKGQVLSAEVLPEFAKQVEISLGTSAITRVDTLAAANARMSNAWVALVGDVTEGGGLINNALKGAMNGIAGLLSLFSKGDLETEVDRFKKLSDGIYENASAAKSAAAESKKLLEEYENLTKDGVVPASNEKERLSQITLLLTDNLGDSVLELNKETGAMELNTEAVKTMIKAKRLAMDVEASQLAIRLQNSKEQEIDADKKISDLNEELKIRESLITAEDLAAEKAAKYNPAGYKEEELPESIQKRNDLLTERNKLNKESFMFMERKNNLIFKLDKLGYNEKEIEALLGVADATAESVSEYENKFDIIKKLEDANKRYGELSTNATDSEKKAIADEIKLLEEQLKFWDLSSDKKKKNSEESKKIMEGSVDALQKIKSELEDERDRLATSSDQRELYNVKIKATEDAIHQLIEAHELLKQYKDDFGYDLSQEGTKAGTEFADTLPQGFGQKQTDDIEATKEAEKEKAEIFELFLNREKMLRIEAFEVAQSINQQILEASKDLNEEELDALKKKLDQEVELEAAAAEAKKELREGLAEILLEVGSGLLDRRVQDVDDEIDANKRLYAEKLDNADLSEEQRSAIEAQRDRKEEELLEKKKKREKQNFLIEQGFALARIAMTLAQTLSAIQLAAQAQGSIPIVGPALAAAHIATYTPIAFQTAALSAGMVLAQTISKYKDGRKGGKEEIAILGDGGKHEPILDKHGNLRGISPNVPTMMKLNEGDTVLPSTSHLNKDYQSILNASVMTTLASASVNNDSEKLAKIFDKKLSELKQNIESGIERGFGKIPKQGNRDLDALANRLKFINKRDAL